VNVTIDELGDLRAGRVESDELAIRNRVTKTPADYGHETRNVAALRRSKDEVGGISPGEDVEYVVVDDEKRSRDRVALDTEDPDEYDTTLYVELTVRAVAGVLGTFGYSEKDVADAIDDHHQRTLPRTDIKCQ